MNEKYEELKQKLTNEQICHILRRLGSSEFRDSGNYLAFKSICHNEDEYDADFNLIYYKDTKLFRCFSECGETFDIYGLVKRRFHIEGEDTHRENLFYFLLNYSDLDFDTFFEKEMYTEVSIQYDEQPLEIILPEYPEHILDVFNSRYCPEWINDGIAPGAMDKYNIKYSISQNKIIIPHYDVNNRLIGIRGRALDSYEAQNFGKYRPVKIEKQIYSHPLGLNLYGLNMVKDNISKTGIAMVAESEKAAMQAESLLPVNVVCSVCGSVINRWQVLQLIKHTSVEEIIICFDRENNEKDIYFNKLYNMCSKYKQYCKFSFIWDEKYLKIKENMFDVGDKELIKFLLQRRVRLK